MIKAVIIGCAHMHVNEIALYIHEQVGIDLIGCADVEAKTPEIVKARYTRLWNLENIKNNYCSTIYDDYKFMLDELKPDIAFILCENANKPVIVEECAKRGVNVSIEKPVAVSYEEAQKIEATIKKYGIEAMVNWPVLWRPYMYSMINAFNKGLIGDLKKLYYINGHTGPLGAGAKHRGVSQTADEMTDEARSKTWWYQKEMGGGAFLDILCYGCMYSALLQKDQPLGVTAYGENLNTPYSDAEDNVTAIIRYPATVTVAEGTWTMPQLVLPAGPVITGDKGVLYTTKVDGVASVHGVDMYGKTLEIPEIEFPSHMKNIAAHYVYCKTTGEPLNICVTFEQNMKVMALLDTAIKASESRKEEKVPCRN
ncbi:MAG: Gfo/Idh/MocA family oxidoreductase [Bacillota bacterium]|nr:Gfo/Idh/MocA family oxidoreductase [Bacillota bacterium]